MVTYMKNPVNKLTLGATELTNTLTTAKIQRVENGFDSATIVLPSTSYYPATVTAGTTVTLEIKDLSDASYTTIFAGIVRFAIPDIGERNTLTLSCLGAGFGLGEMLVGTEYGNQSTNGLDTLTEILTDATYGIIPKYVNKILASATDSGFSYTTTSVDTISDTLPYIDFPYKPAKDAINDLIDLETAIKAGSAGAHWIITTDSVLHVKLLTGTHTGWTKYYGNSQANATLTYGTDYTQINLEKMSPEANYIIYYGAWRRPSNGDAWTEGNASSYGAQDCSVSDETGAGNFKVNTKSIKVTSTSAVDPWAIIYPSTGDWGFDFTYFNEANMPSLNFWAKRPAGAAAGYVRLIDGSLNEIRHQLTLTEDDKWYHFSLPCGQFFVNSDTDIWSYQDADFDWSDVDAIAFTGGADNQAVLYLDGIHFGGAAVCRVAWNSANVTANGAKMKLITDDIGKDDSLVDSDASGLMAQMAYAELLRLQKTATVGTVETPMIKDVLPGQWLCIQSADYRITKLTHIINPAPTGCKTVFEVTDDVTNGRVRSRFEQINRVFASARPEWQDRQASNIKAGAVDLKVTRLVKDYAPP